MTEGQTTSYDRALALQNWLRDTDEFTYSQTLDSAVTDGTGEQAILGFLETRRGYCVQFASTMAVMARMLDIPARVAVGFAAGSDNGQGLQVVGLNDAHAWPELYFQGAGWVAFEPTPDGPASAPPAWARVAPDTTPSDNPSPDASSSSDPATGLGGSENRPREDINQEGLNPGTGGGIGAGPVRVPVLPFVVAVGLLLLLAVPSVTRLLVRRRRWSDADTPHRCRAGRLGRPAGHPRRPRLRLGPQRPAAARRDPARRGAAPGRGAGRGPAPGGGGDRAGPLRTRR